MLVRITCVSGIHVLPNILLWRLGNAQVLCHWQEDGRQRDMNGYLQTILLLCFHLYTVFVYLSEAEHTSSINRTFRECSKTLLWEQTSPCSFWRRLSSYTYPRAVSQMASATPNTSHACQTQVYQLIKFNHRNAWIALLKWESPYSNCDSLCSSVHVYIVSVCKGL